MTPMKRALIIVAVVLVVLLLGAWIFIGSIAKTAIEKGGTYALGVDTTLGSASVHPFGGKFGLSKLEIRNPEGFTSPRFLALDAAALEVTMSSLTKDVVEAQRLELDGIEVFLERTSGKTNYGVILDNLKRFESGKKGGQEQPKEEGGKKFIVREVIVRNVTVHADLLPVGGSLTKTTLTLPELRLTNLGNAKEGLSISELVSQIIAAVLDATVQMGGQVLSPEILKDLSGSLKGLEGLAVKLQEMVGGQVQDIGKTLDGLGKQLGESLDGLLKKH